MENQNMGEIMGDLFGLQVRLRFHAWDALDCVRFAQQALETNGSHILVIIDTLQDAKTALESIIEMLQFSDPDAGTEDAEGRSLAALGMTETGDAENGGKEEEDDDAV